MWPLDLPTYDHRDWWARRAAAWAANLLPTEIRTAVDTLETRPRAAGRVAWRWIRATLDARDRDMDTLSMTAVIPPGLLDGLLADDDVAMLRAMQVPIDTTTPREELERRLSELEEVGPKLPAKWPQ